MKRAALLAALLALLLPVLPALADAPQEIDRWGALRSRLSWARK